PVIFRKRPGRTGRSQQVWKHWDFATDREKQVTLERNMQELRSGRGDSRARSGDHETAGEAASSISREEATRLENAAADAIWNSGQDGLTWDETATITGKDKASLRPRWKPLRHQRRIVFALEEPIVQQPEDRQGRLFPKL